jgi:hypothetical protein
MFFVFDTASALVIRKDPNFMPPSCIYSLSDGVCGRLRGSVTSDGAGIDLRRFSKPEGRL